MLRVSTSRQQPGELTAVIGPNGAGKTTLLRALAGLLPAAAGAALLAGWPPARPTGRRRELARSLAYLPQERTVHWALTRAQRRGARALAASGRWGRRERADRAAIDARAMAAMDIAPLAGRPGARDVRRRARPRAGGARAGAGARVLLADEPAAGLDPAHQLTLFRHLCRALRRAAARSSWRCTICRSPRASATGSCSSTRAARWPRDHRQDVLTPAHLAAAYGIAPRIAHDRWRAGCAGRSTCCHDAAPIRLP